MVARVGAKLLHIAPTHPAARRCGSLKLPHRRSAPRKPAGRQKRRYAPVDIEEPRHRSAGEPARQRVTIFLSLTENS